MNSKLGRKITRKEARELAIKASVEREERLKQERQQEFRENLCDACELRQSNSELIKALKDILAEYAQLDSSKYKWKPFSHPLFIILCILAVIVGNILATIFSL